MNYRKIWEQHYGEIPKDVNNVTYDIHHIDGNRSNNNISNLKAVSLQEHYDIHFEQGEYQSAYFIALRMFNFDPNIKQLMSEHQRELWQIGNHNFQVSPEIKSSWAKSAVHKQIKSNKNKLCGPDNNLSLKEKGIHPLVGGEASRKGVLSQLKSGTHACLRIFYCDLCNKKIKGSANYKRHTKMCEVNHEK